MGTNYYLRPKLAATVKTYIDGAVVESRRDYSEPRLYLAALPDGFTGDISHVLRRADPDMGLHICKVSAGWVPLCECHEGTLLTSWEGVRRCVCDGAFDVVDEYGEVEGPDDFIERVEGHADGYERRFLDKGREVRARSHLQYGDWPDESGVRVEWSGYEFR